MQAQIEICELLSITNPIKKLYISFYFKYGPYRLTNQDYLQYLVN